MKRRKLLVSIIAGLLAALMIFGIIASIIPTHVHAEKSSSEIKEEIKEWEKKKEENEAKMEELEGLLSDNMDKIEDMVEQKNVIDQQVFLLYEQIQIITEEIIAFGELIADKQDELDEAVSHYQALNEKYKERIRAMEEDGNVSYWSVLFKANDFSDLLDRLNMIEEIAASDQRRLAELNQAAKVVENAKASLESEKAELEVSKKELEDATVELAAAKAKAEAILQQLVATGEEYQALLDEAEKLDSEYSGTIDELEYAYDEAKEREYQEWLAAQPKPEPSGGIAGTPNYVDGLTWLIPINYTEFSSPFGYRLHPIYGDWRFHYGVDLSAPQGTPIVASRGGVVTTATYDSSGGGYYVSINHQDGFSTRYLHMTHYIVSPGQYVAAGQVIGYCGSTGASTGPHLHFSVYYNGTAVNPALYINI